MMRITNRHPLQTPRETAGLARPAHGAIIPRTSRNGIKPNGPQGTPCPKQETTINLSWSAATSHRMRLMCGKSLPCGLLTHLRTDTIPFQRRAPLPQPPISRAFYTAAPLRSPNCVCSVSRMPISLGFQQGILLRRARVGHAWHLLGTVCSAGHGAVLQRGTARNHIVLYWTS